MQKLQWFVSGAAALLLSGCSALTNEVLVDEAGQQRAAAVSTHCSGSEWTDNSMIAVVPLPIVGWASPTQPVNEITAGDVLARCGPANRLTNRRVEVDRSWCVPTALTRLVTLGIWHWCPANVSWDADVTVPQAAVTPPAERYEPSSSYRQGFGARRGS